MMPTLSRWAARAALVYLLLGVVAGALYWAQTRWPIWPPLAALNPIYIHLLVVGWLTQFIFAVIYWMFPIISKTNLRGDPHLAVAILVLLNAGLILRAICEPWRAISPTPANSIGLLASAILQVIAAYLMVWVCWPRIRERGGV
jgi:hypothetical protein